MASTIMLAPEAIKSHLIEKMNREITESVEPVIQEAVKEAERTIRKRVGVMIISLLESSFDVRRNVNELIIRLELGKQ